MCKEIWLDKTQHLSKYPIRTPAVENLPIDAAKKGRLKDMVNIRQHLRRITWDILGANVIFENLPSNENKRSTVENDDLDGKYDISQEVYYQRVHWKNEIHTFTQSSFCFLTKKEIVSITDQLLKAFPIKMQLLLFLTSLSVTLLFSELLKISYLEAVTDVLRSILGASMIYQPASKWAKLLVMWFIFTFLVINTYIQSQLSVMLTIVSTKKQENMETSYDLVNNGYKICGLHYNELYLGSSMFNKSGYVDSTSECIELAKNVSNIACVTSCELLKFDEYDQNNELHILRDELLNKYTVYLIRTDSPLRDRIQALRSRLFQHGITQYWHGLVEIYSMKPIPVGFSKISLHTLRYAFYFLLAEYLFSIIVFSVEI